MSRWFFASWALGLLLVTAVASHSATPIGKSTAEAEMFRFLTLSDWCDQGCWEGFNDLPPSCAKLRFLASGRLRRWSFSDYLEYDLAGDWNFTLDTDSTGRILWGGHSLYSFVRRENHLLLSGHEYRRCEEGSVNRADSTWLRNQLPAVPMPTLLSGLCAGPWIKTDEFDRQRVYQALQFDSLLTCDLEYRDGQCVQSATFSIQSDGLILKMVESSCDPRVKRDSWTRQVGAGFRGDTLVFDGNDYVRPERASSLKRSGPLGGHGELFMIVEYDGSLVMGQPHRLSLSFRNQRGRYNTTPFELQSVTVGMTLMKPAIDGLRETGPSILLNQRTYRGLSIPAGGTWTDTVSIVPPKAGEWIALDFEWNYRDPAQTYRPRVSPVVRVRRK